MKDPNDGHLVMGVDYASFLGLIMTLVSLCGVCAMVAFLEVPSEAKWAAAGVGALMSVLGCVLIKKGSGYSGVVSAFKRYPGTWLFTLVLGAFGGFIVFATAAQLQTTVG